MCSSAIIPSSISNIVSFPSLSLSFTASFAVVCHAQAPKVGRVVRYRYSTHVLSTAPVPYFPYSLVQVPRHKMEPDRNVLCYVAAGARCKGIYATTE